MASDFMLHSEHLDPSLNNGVVTGSPDCAAFEQAFPSNSTHSYVDFDIRGNIGDLRPSFWTDQMSSILNTNADAMSYDDILCNHW